MTRSRRLRTVSSRSLILPVWDRESRSNRSTEVSSIVRFFLLFFWRAGGLYWAVSPRDSLRSAIGGSMEKFIGSFNCSFDCVFLKELRLFFFLRVVDTCYVALLGPNCFGEVTTSSCRENCYFPMVRLMLTGSCFDLTLDIFLVFVWLFFSPRLKPTADAIASCTLFVFK